MKDPQHIRIFLSSPGDVADERIKTDEILAAIPREPAWQGKFTIEIVRWDDPHRPATMDAHLTPQEAVDQNKPKPSECEITVVILWSRIGTPFTHEGRRYLSGTEYEYEDALEGSGHVLVYRRTDPPEIPEGDWTDPAYDEEIAKRREQIQLVDKFFERFIDASGEARRAFVPYRGLPEFSKRLRQDIENVLARYTQSEELANDKLISRDQALQFEEAATLARSLDAEIGMVQTRVSQLQRSVNGMMAQDADDSSASGELAGRDRLFAHSRFPRQVYEANAARLGLLHPVIAKRTVHYYTNVDWVEEKLASLTNETLEKQDGRNLGAALLGATFMLQIKGETLLKYLREFARDPRSWSPPDEELEQPDA